jgi:hypothetical protein
MARSQHYRFAHIVLPQLLDEDGEGMIGRLSAADGSDTLLRVWNRLGEQMPLAERVEPKGLGVDSFRLDDGSIVAFVTLPTPTVSPEAWFVVIWASRGAPMNGHEGLPLEHGYYTLELGEAEDFSPMNIVAQWRHGTHANFGEGPPSNEGAFLQAVCTLRGLPAEGAIQALLHYLRARTRSLAVGIANASKITLQGVPSLEGFDRLRRSPRERPATESTFFQRKFSPRAQFAWPSGCSIVLRVSDETDIRILEKDLDGVEKSIEEELDRWMQASKALSPPDPAREKRWHRPLQGMVATEEVVKRCSEPNIGWMFMSELFESRTWITLGAFDLGQDNLGALLSVLPGRREQAPLVPETAVASLGATDDGESMHLFSRLSDELVRCLRRLSDEDLPAVGEHWVSAMRAAGDGSHLLGRGVLVRLVDLARQTGPEAPYIVIDEYCR